MHFHLYFCKNILQLKFYPKNSMSNTEGKKFHEIVKYFKKLDESGVKVAAPEQLKNYIKEGISLFLEGNQGAGTVGAKKIFQHNGDLSYDTYDYNKQHSYKIEQKNFEGRVNYLTIAFGRLIDKYTLRFEDISKTIEIVRRKIRNMLKSTMIAGDWRSKSNRLYPYVLNDRAQQSMNILKDTYRNTWKRDFIRDDLLNRLFYNKETYKQFNMKAPFLDQWYLSKMSPPSTKFIKKYKNVDILKDLKSQYRQNVKNSEILCDYITDEYITLDQFERNNVNPLLYVLIHSLQVLDCMECRLNIEKDYFEIHKITEQNVSKKSFHRQQMFKGCFAVFTMYHSNEEIFIYDSIVFFMMLFLKYFFQQVSKTKAELDLFLQKHPDVDHNSLTKIYPLYFVSEQKIRSNQKAASETQKNRNVRAEKKSKK
jgi:hypothetical protein